MHRSAGAEGAAQSTVPCAAHSPVLSNGICRGFAIQASIRQLPGPQSNPQAGLPGARIVRLAMPPIFSNDAGFGRVAKYSIVKCRHQWRALAAGRDIARTKIRNHVATASVLRAAPDYSAEW